MQISFGYRWLLVVLLLISTCFLIAHGRGRGGGGRGGGSRGGGSRGSSSRGSSNSGSTSSRGSTMERTGNRPAEKPSYPAPAPRPSPKPVVSKPATARPVTARPVKPEEPVVRQPAQNPNFKETSQNQGSSHNQPPYNPNYKPEGPPPPYSPAGQPVPSAPVGPPPPYQPGAGGQLPPYPGPAVRPPAYPGQGAPYPVQPGTYPQQPGRNAPYPVQPGSYPQQPGGNRPYPVQPGSYQPGVNRPYPVQPGSYPGGYRPQPQQPLGSNVWQPQSGMPSPAYMNYGGIPTGTNIYSKPHKKKGFLGSLMSSGTSTSYKPKKNKYYGSYPSPHGVGAGSMGHMAGTSSFLGKHGSSAAMYTILPYMSMKAAPKFRPRFGGGFMPFYMPMPYYHHHHYYGHGYQGRYGYYDEEFNPEYTRYYDVYSNEYAGKCQQPIRKENTQIKCDLSYRETNCKAKCEEGYKFDGNNTEKSHRCWHVTGVWRPKKNFPECKPTMFTAVVRGKVALPCDISPPSMDDSVVLILWYKGEDPIPVYIIDVRRATVYQARQSASTHLENRAYFNVINRPAFLELDPVQEEDAGEYRCRVDFKKAGTVNTVITLKVIAICEGVCYNGGTCTRPGFCRCPPEYRGHRCQFRELNFLDCDVRKIAKGENIGWVCIRTKNETSCKIRCKEPAQFETPPSEEYKCTPDGAWTPDKIPLCFIKEENVPKT